MSGGSVEEVWNSDDVRGVWVDHDDGTGDVPQRIFLTFAEPERVRRFAARIASEAAEVAMPTEDDVTRVAQTVRFPCEQHDSDENTEVPQACEECDETSRMVVRHVLAVYRGGASR